jgi:hypothetical protein
MQNRAILIAGLTAIVLLGLIIGVFVLRYISPVSLYGFGNDILQQAPSPDGKYVAIFFERSCGATTPFVRMVSLRLFDEAFSNDKAANPVFSIVSEPNVNLIWSGPRRLSLVSSQCDENSLRHKTWRDVEVSCTAP